MMFNRTLSKIKNDSGYTAHLLSFGLSLIITSFLLATVVHGSNIRAVSAFVPALNITSPAANKMYSGRLTIAAHLNKTSLMTYDMYWYVDNGSWNRMNDRGHDKAATFNVSGWHWLAPKTLYTVKLVAVLHTNQRRLYGSVPINVAAAASAPSNTTLTAATTAPIQKVAAGLPVSTTANAKLATNLYASPHGNAVQTAATTGDPTMKRIMMRLASVPQAIWFGDWNKNVQSDVSALVTAAATAKATPVLVAYNIPKRDCGDYSSGGAATAADYQTWIQNFASGIGNNQAIVILEPDATALTSCLSATDLAQRYQLLSYSVNTLKSHEGVKVYLDAGNSNWIGASDMAGRLKQAGIANADGFSLNVSNFYTTAANISYGTQLSSLVGGKHFVIDTSRNGNGSNSQWCNPSGRALGSLPTTNTGNPLVDYLLWIKTPGQSDGACNGGPAAGVWWPDYAESLALNAGW